MKKIGLNVGVLVIALAMFSCEDDITSINLNSELEEEVNVSAGEGQSQFTQSVTIDATQDSDIQEYLGKIKEYQIESITYRIEDYQGDASTQFSGSLTIMPSGTATGNTFEYQIDPVTLSTSQGQDIPVNFSQDDLDEIEGLLRASNAVNTSVIGMLSDVPASFRLILKMTIKVKANA
ncbi:hypothetical protein QQ008_08630 [Fulvivirgaceae bacterium BMA10]|uniref:Uncharacterized protein n=1 Tax=Splendidivirga corallicola TaxID=3051826 RepID=A0ABT8KL32_9BACT|nr:hypothetical protein [Fulvivirgaceae bacterium BMA10]